MIWIDFRGFGMFRIVGNKIVVIYFIYSFYFLNSECFVTGGKPSTFIPTFAAFEYMLRLINKKN